MENFYDVAIVGGGLVGSSLAIALHDSGLAVALIEAVAPRTSTQPSYDERNLALARATVTALDTLGVWKSVAARATAIRRIHISRAGEFGSVRLDAQREHLADFGAVLPARELGNGLVAALAAATSLARITPAQVTAVEPAGDAVTLVLQRDGAESRLRARLVVGADGTDSFVRNALGIEVEEEDYAQTLFVGTVTPEREMDGCAYERFTDHGPVALLPLTERRAGLILSVPSADADAIAALDDASYLALAQERFGWRAGRFLRAGKRMVHPIRRVIARTLAAPRAVLVGNAAQTIHPIGAQGFNLGLRDALTLAELAIAAARAGRDVGQADVLAEYAQRRREDREGTLAFSDGLVRLACSPAKALAPMRSLGMALLDGVAPLREMVSRRGMGFRGVPNSYALGVKP
jgi:2-octaprenyl-6-methoxyphenol hydroxylase